jgi:hypothetical protein
MAIEQERGTDSFSSFTIVLVVLTAFQAGLAMMNCWTVIPTHDLGRLKRLLQSCPHEPIYNQGHYKLNIRKGDYTLLWFQKEANTNISNDKRGHYKIFLSQKADITNFCNEKSGQYKLL